MAGHFHPERKGDAGGDSGSPPQIPHWVDPQETAHPGDPNPWPPRPPEVSVVRKALHPRPQIVFFDAGGVLVHFPPAEARVTAALRSLGLERPAAVVVDAVRRARAARDEGGPGELLWPFTVEDARILGAARVLALSLGLPADAAGYLRDTCYHMNTLVLYADALPAIDAVAERGIAVGLISNAAGSLRGALHRLGLATRLRPTIISAEIGICKPDPGIYTEALRSAGVTDPARALFIDDLPPNVAAARAAGMVGLHLDRDGGRGDLRTLEGLTRHLG